MKTATYMDLRARYFDGGWHEHAKGFGLHRRPTTAEDFAFSAISVILHSGMKNAIAVNIMPGIRDALLAGGSASRAFGYQGKTDAMDAIWDERKSLFREFKQVSRQGEEAVLDFCEELRFIGPITKYHLAKNLGLDVAKPDRHLKGVADMYGMDTHEMCRALADATGDSVALVDSVIWRACERGWLRYSKRKPTRGPATPSCREIRCTA